MPSPSSHIPLCPVYPLWFGGTSFEFEKPAPSGPGAKLTKEFESPPVSPFSRRWREIPSPRQQIRRPTSLRDLDFNGISPNFARKGKVRELGGRREETFPEFEYPKLETKMTLEDKYDADGSKQGMRKRTNQSFPIRVFPAVFKRLFGKAIFDGE